MLNFYETLGVSRSATAAEIRARFRELARERHPDRFQGEEKQKAEKDFQLLTEAMNVLTSEQRRKAHDFELDKGGREAATDPIAVAKTYLSIGAKAYKDGNFAGAYENFDMAVKHNPKDGKAHHFLALASRRVRGQMRRAVDAIAKAAELEPMNPTILKDAGIIYRQAGLAQKAVRAFQQAAEWSPEDAEIQVALAELAGGKVDPSKGLMGSIFGKGKN